MTDAEALAELRDSLVQWTDIHQQLADKNAGKPNASPFPADTAAKYRRWIAALDRLNPQAQP